MKKKLIFIALFILILVLLPIGTEYLLPNKQNLPQESLSTLDNETASPKEEVTLTLDFGDGNTLSYAQESSEELTVFTILQKVAEENNLQLETQQYDFGIFVKSINGYESSSDVAWIYFVNGDSGQVAADQYELKPGDKVEWKYIAPSANNQ